MSVVIEFDGVAPDAERPLGIDVATREFLRAFFRYADQSTFNALTPSAAAFASFRDMATEEHIAAQRCRQVGLDDAAALEAAGVVVRYDPALATLAWHRRRHGQSRYSLVGITHACASAAVRDAIGALATAPVQAWDAVICPSQSIRRAVSAVLDGWQSYLEARFGGAAACPLHLPVIPLGVDTVRFEKISAPDRRALARRRLGVGDDAVVILYAGRLNYIAKANPLPLLVAAERVAETLAKPIHLVLNGYFNDDENERAFDEAIAALCNKVQVAIVRHGHADFPDGLWAAADILVRNAASPTIRSISATSRCGERLRCSMTTAASERAYEKAFSVWSWETSSGMGTKMAGRPQLAISKMVPEPARATMTVAMPAAMRSAKVFKRPKTLYRSAYGESLSTTEATLLTSARFTVPA